MMNIPDRVGRINQADLTVSQADILHILVTYTHGIFSTELKKETGLTVLAESINNTFRALLMRHGLTIKYTWVPEKDRWFLQLMTTEEAEAAKETRE